MHFVRKRCILEHHRRSHENDHRRRHDEDNTEPLLFTLGPGAVLSRKCHEHRPDLNRDHSGREHHVRRADDLHIEAVRVVPPVVEWRRRDHHQRAPDANPCAKRGVEVFPEANRFCACVGGARECRAQGEVSAAQPGNDCAGLLEKVRRRPEGVAADGAVPGDVPDQSDDDRG